MMKKPDALFIVDAKMEDIAVKEAIRTNVTTVAITDTNSDPQIIDYPIPANDDATGSLELIIGYITDAWIEGKNSIKSQDNKNTAKKTEKKPDPKPDKKVKYF
jgi:small subunit ribosomal protein S2